MIIWIAFIALIVFFLALDLGVFHKDPHAVTAKEAINWTMVWASVSLAFSGVIYKIYLEGWTDNVNNLTPQQAVLDYLTGYVIELSLSMDNIFVIAVIFAYFGIPKVYQHRVLFWGILGAIFFRAIMIVLGVVLINKFSFMTYLFGALLLYSAYKMFSADDQEVDPRRNPLVKLTKRFFPVVNQFVGNRFFVKRGKYRAATPLFIALLVVETTDVLFAIDSIPAILAITTDPFLVFSSNIFAILGLRSLYFVLASMLDRFHLLKYSLVFILAFVGVKMILIHHVHFPEWLSLAVIFTSLAVGIIASLIQSSKHEAPTTDETFVDERENKQPTGEERSTTNN
jgi:tellurite resistance protein TerC